MDGEIDENFWAQAAADVWMAAIRRSVRTTLIFAS